MNRKYVIETISKLLMEMKDYGTPSGMTDETYFNVVVDLEDALEKVIENEGE